MRYKKKMKIIKILVEHMPEYCGDCKFLDEERKYCVATRLSVIDILIQEAGFGIAKRPFFCPLEESERK